MKNLPTSKDSKVLKDLLGVSAKHDLTIDEFINELVVMLNILKDVKCTLKKDKLNYEA